MQKLEQSNSTKVKIVEHLTSLSPPLPTCATTAIGPATYGGILGAETPNCSCPAGTSWKTNDINKSEPGNGVIGPFFCK